MKETLLFIILSGASRLYSQSFTNGSVYDYNVGDTIVTSFQRYSGSGLGPPTYTYRVFTSKNFSAANDAIYYTAHDVVMTMTTYPYPAAISVSNVSFTVIALTSSAIDISNISHPCMDMEDTSYANNCGMHEYFSHGVPIIGTGCFEYPNVIEYRVIEGVGTFRNTSYHPGADAYDYYYDNYKEDLVWFRKGNKHCGTASAIPDGLQERIIANDKLKVYPNPSNGICTVDVSKEGLLSVESISGNEVYMSVIPRNKSQIDLSYLPSGIYFIKCRNEDGVYRARIVIEH